MGLIRLLRRTIGTTLVFIFFTIIALNIYIIFFLESAVTPNSLSEVEINEEVIRYQIWEGDGSTAVILVGGLSAWSATWENTVREQRKRGNNVTFVAIDLPPFGYSITDPASGYTRDIQAKRIADFTATLPYENIILVGHSYGGGPIAELALTNPPWLSGTILISPVLLLDLTEERQTPSWLKNYFLTRGIIRPVLYADFLLLKQFQSFVYIQDHVTPELLSVYTAPLRYPQTPTKLILWLTDFIKEPIHSLQSTKSATYTAAESPMILLWGDKDTITPITDADAIANLPLVQLQTLVGVGHIPMVEDIEYFNNELYTVLREININ